MELVAIAVIGYFLQFQCRQFINTDAAPGPNGLGPGRPATLPPALAKAGVANINILVPLIIFEPLSVFTATGKVPSNIFPLVSATE